MGEKEDLRLLKKINLGNFNTIMAFTGWPDAKKVATYAADYLKDKLKAEKIGEIDWRHFYDFVIERPSVNIKHGLMKDYIPPVTELYYWKAKSSDKDLLIITGAEPNTNWSRYAEAIFQALSLGKVNRICLLGGLVDRIPHTVNPLISGVANAPDLVEEMKRHGVEPTDYSGPSSIHSQIMVESDKRGIPTLSIWGHAPEYVGDLDPRTAHELLRKVLDLLSMKVDLEELQMERNLFQKHMDSLMNKDPDFSQLVRKLEIEYRNARRNPEYVA